MNGTPAVLVKKGGFFSGLFWFLAIVVLVVGALGLFGLYVVHSTAGGLLSSVAGLAQSGQQWSEVLPPVVAEALNDHRDPAYRDQLDVKAELVDTQRGRTVVLDVLNQGPRTVSVLAVVIRAEDGNGVPVREWPLYVATPFTVPDEGWLGPLMPDARRRIRVGDIKADGTVTLHVEVSELRVWNEQSDGSSGEAGTPTPPIDADSRSADSPA